MLSDWVLPHRSISCDATRAGTRVLHEKREFHTTARGIDDGLSPHG